VYRCKLLLGEKIEEHEYVAVMLACMPALFLCKRAVKRVGEDGG
jgi:hypothetical protein